MGKPGPGPVLPIFDDSLILILLLICFLGQGNHHCDGPVSPIFDDMFLIIIIILFCFLPKKHHRPLEVQVEE